MTASPVDPATEVPVDDVDSLVQRELETIPPLVEGAKKESAKMPDVVANDNDDDDLWSMFVGGSSPGVGSSLEPKTEAKAETETEEPELDDFFGMSIEENVAPEAAVVEGEAAADEPNPEVAVAPEALPEAPPEAAEPEVVEPELPPGVLPVDLGSTIPYGAPPVKTQGLAVDALLDRLGHKGGSVFGWSILGRFRRCLRAGYYYTVLGWRPKPRPPESVNDKGKVQYDPFALGSLVHACSECYLCSLYDLEAHLVIVDSIKPFYPGLAAETQRLWGYYLDRYAANDSSTWDVRFVELESRYYYPARKCGSRRMSLCISSRHDAGFAQLDPGAPRRPLGERYEAGRVYVHELKTTAQMSSDSAAGFRHDPQVLQNLVCARFGRPVERDGALAKVTMEERYGPVEGVVITQIGKALNHDPNKHMARERYPVALPLVEEYRDTLGDWLYEELGPRLFSDENVRLKPSTWPKSYTECRDVVTNRQCPFLRMCENVTGVLPQPEVWYDRADTLNLTLLEAKTAPKAKAKRGRKAKASAQVVDK